MTAGRGPATRQNLLALQRRLERVGKGAALLRRKREALVSELFRIAKPAAVARVTIAESAARAYPVLLDALADEGYTGLRAIGWPDRDLLDHDPEDERDRGRGHEAGKGSPPEIAEQHPGDVSAHEDHRAQGHVQGAEGPVDQGHADRHQRIERARDEPAHERLEERPHRCPLRSPGRWPSRPRRPRARRPCPPARCAPIRGAGPWRRGRARG